MTEEIYFENGRISNFQRHVTLTLNLDRVTWHTIVHRSSTSTYEPNFIRIGETFCGRTEGRRPIRTYERIRTDGQTSTPALLRWLEGVDLITGGHRLLGWGGVTGWRVCCVSVGSCALCCFWVGLPSTCWDFSGAGWWVSVEGRPISTFDTVTPSNNFCVVHASPSHPVAFP